MSGRYSLFSTFLEEEKRRRAALMDKTGELVEAPENNEKKPETNLKQTKTVKKPTVDDVIDWGATSSYAVLCTVAQQCFPDFMCLDDAAEYLHKLHEKAKEKATVKGGVAAVFANLQGQMSSITKAKAEEDDAVNQDDQSNETLNEEGELVEAPKNNEKPETNLKRKNAMLNGRTLKKKQKQAAIITANTLKHVQKMKSNVAMINASDVEEMDKAIKEISESDMPEEMQSIVKELSLTWVKLSRKLNK